MKVEELLLKPPVEVPLQQVSLSVWESKYCLKDKNGNAIDYDINASFTRVAQALAANEDEASRKYWTEQFMWALKEGAIPAGRIMSNAGAMHHKPATSLINCTVSETVEDSMANILQRNMDAGLTLKAGCGIGYNFSTLRPSGAHVSGSGAQTSGPLSFMDVFDKTCFTVMSAGGRRGAQMGCMEIGHPDVLNFIKAKREDGRLRQFNLSVLVSGEFIKAVKANADWKLAFPATKADIEEGCELIYRKWPTNGDGRYTKDSLGRVAMRVYKTVSAAKLWNLIMVSTYDYAEPGFLLIDEVNEMNNNWFCENIVATNPCAEQPLPPGGSCLLGSINLTKFVLDPFSEKAKFDWQKFDQVVRVFTRMLDNVVELNGLPLQVQRDEILSKRRHGMGYLGLGSAMSMLGIAYGSTESLEFTSRVTRQLAVVGWEEALSIAKEKGPAPILLQEFEVTAGMLAQRPEMVGDGYKVEDRVSGKVLHATYSRYMQRIASVAPELVKELADVGARFTHHSSIAPTGTIALSFGNNCSNGIEPTFAHCCNRNIIVPGKKTKEQVEVCSYELLAYRELVNPGATVDDLPSNCSTSEVSPKAHIDVQAAAQYWVDSSISKTINVPTAIKFEDFMDVYMYAVDKGLKGCTTFRYNPANFSGVIVKKDDLANTTYEFVLEDGSTVLAKGDEVIEYDGETHSAGNLFDALKEGFYGKL